MCRTTRSVCHGSHSPASLGQERDKTGRGTSFPTSHLKTVGQISGVAASAQSTSSTLFPCWTGFGGESRTILQQRPEPTEYQPSASGWVENTQVPRSVSSLNIWDLPDPPGRHQVHPSPLRSIFLAASPQLKIKQVALLSQEWQPRSKTALSCLFLPVPGYYYQAERGILS